MIYEAGQLRNFLPFVPQDSEWFLLAGPADANEAFDMRAARPDICIVGFEPNPVMFNIQRARGFPGLLLPLALWSEGAQLELAGVNHPQGFIQEHRSSSVVKFMDDRKFVYKVEADSLDNLSNRYGPFVKAVLWADIEGAELECLIGARQLLDRRQILALNVEVFAENYMQIAKYLQQFGFIEASRWNANKQGDREWWNSVFILQ